TAVVRRVACRGRRRDAVVRRREQPRSGRRTGTARRRSLGASAHLRRLTRVDRLVRDEPAGPASADRKILEANNALSAIGTANGLRTVPEASTSFAYFQLHTQLHGTFSRGSVPDTLFAVLSGAGAVGTRSGAPGSVCPVGGVSAGFLIDES